MCRKVDASMHHFKDKCVSFNVTHSFAICIHILRIIIINFSSVEFLYVWRLLKKKAYISSQAGVQLKLVYAHQDSSWHMTIAAVSEAWNNNNKIEVFIKKTSLVVEQFSQYSLSCILLLTFANLSRKIKFCAC